MGFKYRPLSKQRHLQIVEPLRETALQLFFRREASWQIKRQLLLPILGPPSPNAIQSLTNISDHVKRNYPQAEIRLVFTSSIIRSIWKRRRQEAQKWLEMGVPKEVLYVKNIFQTVGDLQDEGYRNIIVSNRPTCSTWSSPTI